MDVGSAFTYMFDDEDWIKKLAIGGGIMILGIILIPLLGLGLLLFLPISGYMIGVLKNVRDGHRNPLPEWADFGTLFMTGLFVFLIGLVYNLPAILLSCGSSLIQVLPEMAEMGSDEASAVAFVVVCLTCVQLFFSLAAAFFLPAAYIRYAQHDSIGAAFQIGEIIALIRNNLGDYIIVALLSIVAGMLAGFGIILCLIGVFFTMFWSVLVKANLYGQLARKAQGLV